MCGRWWWGVVKNWMRFATGECSVLTLEFVCMVRSGLSLQKFLHDILVHVHALPAETR